MVRAFSSLAGSTLLLRKVKHRDGSPSVAFSIFLSVIVSEVVVEVVVTLGPNLNWLFTGLRIKNGLYKSVFYVK